MRWKEHQKSRILRALFLLLILLPFGLIPPVFVAATDFSLDKIGQNFLEDAPAALFAAGDFVGESLADAARSASVWKNDASANLKAGARSFVRDFSQGLKAATGEVLPDVWRLSKNAGAGVKTAAEKTLEFPGVLGDAFNKSVSAGAGATVDLARTANRTIVSIGGGGITASDGLALGITAVGQKTSAAADAGARGVVGSAKDLGDAFGQTLGLAGDVLGTARSDVSHGLRRFDYNAKTAATTGKASLASFFGGIKNHIRDTARRWLGIEDSPGNDQLSMNGQISNDQEFLEDDQRVRPSENQPVPIVQNIYPEKEIQTREVQTKEIQTIHTKEVQTKTETIVVDGGTKDRVEYISRQMDSDRPNYSLGQSFSLPSNLVGRRLGIGDTSDYDNFTVDEDGNVNAQTLVAAGDVTVQGNFSVTGAQTFSGAVALNASTTVPLFAIDQSGAGAAFRADNITLKGSTISTNDADTNLLINPNGTGAVQFHTVANYIDSTGNLVLDGDITLTSGGTFYTTDNGNLVFAPNGTGNLVVGDTDNAASIVPFADSTLGYDLGSSSQRWYDIYAKGKIDIDQTALNRSSLDFVSAGAITTGASQNLTLLPGAGGKTRITDGTDYVDIADGTQALYAVKGATAAKLADGTYAVDATGDIRLSGDITVSGGRLNFGAGAESIDNETANLLKLTTTGNTRVVLGDDAGTYQFQIADSGGNVVASIDSDGKAVLTGISSSGNISPATDLGASLGDATHRFNDIYVANINTSGMSTSGQAVFTYQPLSTDFAQSSVLVNPSSAIAGAPLLGVGVAGVQKFFVDRDGAGYFAGNVGIGTTSPAGALHVAGGQCVTGDTLLRARRRRKKKNERGEWIEEEYFEDVRIDQIKPGDEILTLDENTGRLVVSRVNALMDMGVKEIYKLTTTAGKTIRTTANHPYLAVDKFDDERVAVFIDSANFEMSCRFCGLEKDYVKMDKFFFGAAEKNTKTLRFYKVDFGGIKQRRFFNFLNIIGAKIVSKPIKVIKQKQKANEHKANFDVELAVDAVELKEKYDMAIIVSGDSDFAYLTKHLQKSGKKTIVVSPWRRTGKELRGQADMYFDLNDMPFVGRIGIKKPPVGGINPGFSPALPILSQVHPFVKGAGKWKKVSNLREGQMIAVVGDNGKPQYERIAKIEKLPPEQVYDIEVEGTHNFVGNGIVAHNTYLQGADQLNTSFALRVQDSTAADKFVITNAGNVGIGTTAPGDKLHIAMGANSGGLTITGKSDNTVEGQLGYINGSGTFLWMEKEDGTLTNLIRSYGNSYFNSGNVGIGTTSPGYTLDVNGGFRVGNATSTAGIVFDPSTGNVGIGTTSPSRKLDVAGNIALSNGGFIYGDTAAPKLSLSNTNGASVGYSNNYFWAGTSSARIYTNNTAAVTVDSSGKVGIGIGTTSPAELLDVNGRLRLAQTTAPETIADKLYNVSGNLVWNGVNLTAGGALPSGAEGQLLYNNNGAWTAFDGLYWDDTNSRLGIGTTSPVQKLDVAGNIRATGSVYTSSGAGVFTNLKVGNTATSGNTYFSLISNNTEQVRIDGSGNVGIGTTSPGQALTVNGNIQAAGTLYLNSGTTGFGAVVSSTNGTGGGTIKLFQPSHATLPSAIQLLPDGTAALTVLQGGNVGIGTTSPSSRLHVVGADTSTSTVAQIGGSSGTGLVVLNNGYVGIGTATPSNALQVTGTSYFSGNVYGNIFDSISAGTAAYPVFTRSGDADTGMFFPVADNLAFTLGGSEKVRIDSAGNVGIGTASPGQKLDVVGDALRLGNVVTDTTAKIGRFLARPYNNANVDWSLISSWSTNTTNEVWIGGNDNAYNAATEIKFFTADNNNTLKGVEHMRIDSSGNVGIGTTAPAAGYKLDVAGNINSAQTVNQETYPSINASQTASDLQDGSAFTGTDATMATMYQAVQFTASDAHTMGDFTVRVKESADITNTTQYLIGYIYADDGGSPSKPGALLATGISVRFGTLTTSYQILSMGTSYTMVSGTKYWLVLKYSAAPTGGNIILDSDASSNMGATSADGTSWTNTNVRLRYVIRGRTYYGGNFFSTNNFGVRGLSTNSFGVYGNSTNSYGIYGSSTNNYGIYGLSANNVGVYGGSTNGYGVYGNSTNSAGVYGSSTNYYGGNFFSVNSTGAVGSSTNGYGVVGTSTNNIAGYLYINPATTNTVGEVLRLRRQTSGTAADGIGGSMDFYTEDSAGTDELTGRIGNLLTTATSGSETSALTFWTRTGGAALAEALRIDGAGNVGIGTIAPTSRFTVRGDSSGAVADLMRLENLGTAAANSGVGLQFIANRTTGGATEFGRIDMLATGIGDTDYSGALQFKIAANGLLETVAEFGNPNIVLNRPLQVNVAGDTGISYDLQFMSTGNSHITSNGPLTIAAGSINRAQNLVLTTQSNEQTGDFGTAATTTATTLTDSDKAWTADEWIGGAVTIISGAGKGQTQTITDNDATSITVADWDATLGDPAANSVYRLSYAPGGDILMNLANSNNIFGGFKILGNDNGGYAFRVAPDGNVYVGGEGAAGSNLFVKQNITSFGGILSLRQLDISSAGTPAATTATSGGSCADSTAYYYKVTAINDNGETTGTAQFTVTTGASGSGINLNTIAWSTVTGATGYKIYRSTENNDWDGDANDQWVDGKVVAAPAVTYDDNCAGDTASLTPPVENTTGGKLAINTTGSTRRFEVLENTSAIPQMKIVSDSSNYAEFYADATGDLNIKLTGSGGDDLTLLDENMKICAGGDFGSVSCPASGFSISGTGNLIVENKVVANDFERICPDGYIWVPGSAKFGTMPGFCVMKYEAKDDDSVPTSKAAEAPWVSVSQEAARAYCQSLGAGYHLVSEPEWMTIAENIAATPINDIDAGAGLQLATGHTDNDPTNALAAGTDPAVSACNLRLPLSDAANAFAANCQLRDSGAVYGYSGTGNQWADTGYVAGGNNKSQLRVHALSNGNTVWDIAGNVWEWTDKISICAEHPYNLSATTTSDWMEYNLAAGINYQGFSYLRPADDGWSSANGIGKIYTDIGDTASATRAFLRGGSWHYTSYAGVFALYLTSSPASADSSVGFRCAR